VRRAIGASRTRLVRQMLTESLVLSLAGGTVGLAVASSSLGFLRHSLPSQFAGLPGIHDAGLDIRVLLAALAVTTLTAAFFGVVPALVASKQRVAIALNEEARGSSGGIRTSRLRSGLVVAELALSLILLVGASLLIVSFYHLSN